MPTDYEYEGQFGGSRPYPDNFAGNQAYDQGMLRAQMQQEKARQDAAAEAQRRAFAYVPPDPFRPSYPSSDPLGGFGPSSPQFGSSFSSTVSAPPLDTVYVPHFPRPQMASGVKYTETPIPRVPRPSLSQPVKPIFLPMGSAIIGFLIGAVPTLLAFIVLRTYQPATIAIACLTMGLSGAGACSALSSLFHSKPKAFVVCLLMSGALVMAVNEYPASIPVRLYPLIAQTAVATVQGLNAGDASHSAQGPASPASRPKPSSHRPKHTAATP